MQELLSKWDPVVGDRQQKLVFIGLHMDAPKLQACIEECLLTEEEMSANPETWADFADPLEPWLPDDDDEDDEWEFL